MGVDGDVPRGVVGQARFGRLRAGEPGLRVRLAAPAVGRRAAFGGVNVREDVGVFVQFIGELAHVVRGAHDQAAGIVDHHQRVFRHGRLVPSQGDDAGDAGGDAIHAGGDAVFALLELVIDGETVPDVSSW